MWRWGAGAVWGREGGGGAAHLQQAGLGGRPADQLWRVRLCHAPYYPWSYSTASTCLNLWYSEQKPRIGLRLVQSAANEETWKVRQISIPDYAAMKPVLKSLQSRSFVTTLETALSACLSLVTFKLSQISIHTVKWRFFVSISRRCFVLMYSRKKSASRIHRFVLLKQSLH